MAWLQQIIQKIARDKKICGLEVHFEGSDQYTLQACLIENKRGIIQIIKNGGPFQALSEAKEWLGEDIPLHLGIDGKGIVHKTIPETANPTLEGLLGTALPNANPGDFWLQSYTSPGQIHLSIARNDIVEQIMQEAKKLKLTILDAVLGPFALASLIPLLPLAGTSTLLKNTHYQVEVDQEGISAIEKSPENKSWQITIGEESLSQTQTGPYALAISAYIPNAQITHNKAPELHDVRDEWEQKLVHKTLLKAGLTGIFVLLLANFLLLSHFKSNNENLNYQMAFNQNNISELGKLKKELKEKNKFLNTIGWSGNARLAYYGDRLAMDLPKTIKWQELQIFPLDEQVLKKDKKRIFQNNLITIAGVSDGPVVLNNWINQLQKYDWVQEIRGQQYKYNSQSKKGEFRFEIIIAED